METIKEQKHQEQRNLLKIGLDIEFKLVEEIVKNLKNTQTDADTYYIIIGKILFFKNLHRTDDGYKRLLFLINSINGSITKEETNKTHLIYLLVDHFFNKYNLVKPQQCKIGGGKNVVYGFLKALLFTLGYVGANNLIVQNLTSPMFLDNVQIKNNTNAQHDLNCMMNDVGFCFLLAESQTVPPDELSGVFTAFSDNSDTFINSAKHSTELRNMVGIPPQHIVKVFGHEEDLIPSRPNYMDGKFIGPLSTRQTSFVNRVFAGIAKQSPVKYSHYEQVSEINDKYECIKLYDINATTCKIIQHNFITLMAERHIINAINSKTNVVKYEIGNYVTFSVAFSDGIIGHVVIGAGVEVYTDEEKVNTKVLYCIIESNMLGFMKAYESHREVNFSSRLKGNDSPFTCSVGFFSENGLANFQTGMVKEVENPIATVLTGYNKLNATLSVVIPKPITSPRQSVLPIYSEEFNKGVYDKEKFREEVNKMSAKRMVVKRLLLRGEKEKEVIEEIAKKLASVDSEINRLAAGSSQIESLDNGIIVDDTLNDIIQFLNVSAIKLSSNATTTGRGIKTTKKGRKVKKVKKGTRFKKNKK